MKKILLFISGIMVLSLVACSTGSVGENKRIVYVNGELVAVDKNDLVNNADIIIEGTVVFQEVQKDFKGFPATDTVLKVNRVYKGEPGETVEIRINGGETDEMILIPDDEFTPVFNIGEKFILFLTGNKGSRPDKNDFGYYIVGYHQGRFMIHGENEIKNEVHSFNLDSFTDEIKAIEEENKKNNLPKIWLPEGEESDI